MNQILTDEDIAAAARQVNPEINFEGFARAIEQAILAKLNSAEPVAFYDGNKFFNNEESASMCCANMAELKPLFTHPPAPSGRELQHEHSMKQFQEVCNGRNCYSSKARPAHSEECKADHEACYPPARSEK